MLTKEDVLKAKEVYLSKYDEILIPQENRNYGYRFEKETVCWEVIKRWCSWKDTCRALTGEEALKIMEKWTKSKQRKNRIINSAIEFATQKHKGQFRKGTTIPYILHPIEVLQILYSMKADTKLMVAGILHDTVEDTDTSLDEIKSLFGKEVARLVACNSEDKNKSWNERKKHTIDMMKTADQEEKMLVMADKLSNMRSIAHDYEHIGDSLWKRFNAPKEKQARYYDKILDSLYDMQFVPECEKFYWEFTGLFKDVFVKYFLDEDTQTLYQVYDGINVCCLKKGNPQWRDVSTPPCVFSYEVLDNITPLKRKDAELLEDIWNKPFWDCHNNDMQDGSFNIFCSSKRTITIQIINSQLIMLCEDYGKECASINGTDEYEFSYSLDEENTHRFLVQLRMRYGTDESLECIFEKTFGKDGGPKIFKNFCEEIQVYPKFFSR